MTLYSREDILLQSGGRVAMRFSHEDEALLLGGFRDLRFTTIFNPVGIHSRSDLFVTRDLEEKLRIKEDSTFLKNATVSIKQGDLVLNSDRPKIKINRLNNQLQSIYDSDDGTILIYNTFVDLIFRTGPTQSNQERLGIKQDGRIWVGEPDESENTNFSVYNQKIIGLKSFTPFFGAGARYSIRGQTESTNISGHRYGVSGVVSGELANGKNSYAIHGSSFTTDPDSYAVYASGNMHYTGSFTNSSDQKIKKNIQDMPSVLDRVMQLETKTYEFDRENHPYANFAEGLQHGFIAQNVRELFPTVVVDQQHSFETGEDEESGDIEFEQLQILGMKTMEMIPILTKAIQEQQELIQQQRELISTLQSGYDSLSEKVEQLLEENQTLTFLNRQYKI